MKTPRTFHFLNELFNPLNEWMSESCPAQLSRLGHPLLQDRAWDEDVALKVLVCLFFFIIYVYIYYLFKGYTPYPHLIDVFGKALNHQVVNDHVFVSEWQRVAVSLNMTRSQRIKGLTSIG